MMNDEDKIKKLKKALAGWIEYFEAIRDGEYETNRRTSPLRDYEEVLLLSSKRAIELAKVDKGE